MAVSKVYTCDLCGQSWLREELMRLGVRRPEDRPEDSDYVYVGPCCHDKPVSAVLAVAVAARELAVNG